MKIKITMTIKIKSKAQSWSIDIAIGVIVFVLAFFVFYTLLNANPNARVNELKKEATIIIKQVGSKDSKLSIVDNNEINDTRIGSLKNINYEELKRALRIEGDFCIYLEDDKGDIVLINRSYKGVGSSNIDLGGTPCSQK